MVRRLQLGFDAFRDADRHAVPHVLQHLIIAEPLEREAAKGDDLVEQDAVRPDVRHRREQAVDQTLRSHPSDRHLLSNIV